MTIQLNDLGDGRFELVEMKPVSLGILTSRWVAERFADFLDSIPAEERRQFEDFTADPEGAHVSAEGISASTLSAAKATDDIDLVLGRCEVTGALAVSDTAGPETIEPEAAPADVPETTEVGEGKPAAALRKVTPIEEAFQRLAAGEAVGVVADDMGMPMPRLRGLWARRCRAVKDEEDAARAGMTECSTCGREFRPGSDGADNCARCSRALGLA